MGGQPGQFCLASPPAVPSTTPGTRMSVLAPPSASNLETHALADEVTRFSTEDKQGGLAVGKWLEQIPYRPYLLGFSDLDRGSYTWPQLQACQLPDEPLGILLHFLGLRHTGPESKVSFA